MMLSKKPLVKRKQNMPKGQKLTLAFVFYFNWNAVYEDFKNSG
jgi:hypothetical protein